MIKWSSSCFFLYIVPFIFIAKYFFVAPSIAIKFLRSAACDTTSTALCRRKDKKNEWIHMRSNHKMLLNWLKQCGMSRDCRRPVTWTRSQWHRFVSDLTAVCSNYVCVFVWWTTRIACDTNHLCWSSKETSSPWINANEWYGNFRS